MGSPPILYLSMPNSIPTGQKKRSTSQMIIIIQNNSRQVIGGMRGLNCLTAIAIDKKRRASYLLTRSYIKEPYSPDSKICLWNYYYNALKQFSQKITTIYGHFHSVALLVFVCILFRTLPRVCSRQCDLPIFVFQALHNNSLQVISLNRNSLLVLTLTHVYTSKTKDCTRKTMRLY